MRRAAAVALAMVLLQLAVASSMILLHLPPVLRSLHEATGVGIWLSCFTLFYLARVASRHDLAAIESHDDDARRFAPDVRPSSTREHDSTPASARP